MDDNSLMPFGKFKGHALANVPAWYLLWLLNENKCNGELKQYIIDNKQILEGEK